MKYLKLILLALVIACQSKNVNEQKTDSLTADSPSVVATGETFSPPVHSAPVISTFHLPSPIDSFDVFIDANTTLYSKASLESDVVKEITEFTPATELQETEKREPEDSDVCNRYLWYEVKLPDSSTGWIYGSSIEIKSSTMEGWDVEINEKTYRLSFLADTGTGASNEEGLTGCSEYIIPYLYNADENIMHFIQGSQWQSDDATQLFITNYLNWTAFTSSEGGSANIQSVKVEDTTVILELSVSYQDGGANGELSIDFRDGNFIYSSCSLVREENQYEEEAEDPRDDFADSSRVNK